MFELTAADPALVCALTACTQAGDLPGAYNAVRHLKLAEARSVALSAGFSVVGGKKPADFWLHFQEQIARAAAARTDGWGLRGKTKPDA